MKHLWHDEQGGSGSSAEDELFNAAYAEFLRRIELEEDVDPEAFVQEWPLAIRERLADALHGFRAVVRQIAVSESFAPGDAIDTYLLEEQIGKGGMGIVWRAHDTQLDRRVALKLLHAETLLDPRARDRFLQEARAASRVHHPNIVTLFGVGEREVDGGGSVPYLVQEYVPGARTLAAELAERKRRASLPPGHDGDTARYFLVTAEALHYAHQRGLVHGDLKPSNLLVGEGELPKIIDLGLARIEGDVDTSDSHRLSGTIQYAAPELLAAKDARQTKQSDVFALGACLFEALALSPLRDASDWEGAHAQARDGSVVDPRSVRAKVPDDLARICMRAIARDPGERYASMAGLADDLRHYLAHEPITAGDTPRWRRFRMWARRKPAQAILLALAVVLIVSESALLLQLRASRARTRHAEEALPLLSGLYNPDAPVSSAQREDWLGEAERAALALGRAERQLSAALFLAIGEIRLGLGEAELAVPALEAAHGWYAHESSRWSWVYPWTALRFAHALRAVDRGDEADEHVLAAARRAPVDPDEPVLSRLTGEYALIVVKRNEPALRAEFEARYGDPLQHLEACARELELDLGAQALATLETQAARGLCREHAGDLVGAALDLQAVAATAVDTVKATDVFLIGVHADLARVFAALNRHGEAARELAIVHARLRRALGADDPRTLRAQLALAWGELRARELESALASFEQVPSLAPGDAALVQEARRGRDVARARSAIGRMGLEGREEVTAELRTIAADMQSARASLAPGELWTETTLDLVQVVGMLGETQRAGELLDELEARIESEQDPRRVQTARLRAEVFACAGARDAELRARELAVDAAASCAPTPAELELTTHFELASALARAGQVDEAELGFATLASGLEQLALDDPGRAAWDALLDATRERDPQSKSAQLEELVRAELGEERAPDRAACAARWLAAVGRREAARVEDDLATRDLLIDAAGLLPLDDRAAVLRHDRSLLRPPK